MIDAKPGDAWRVQRMEGRIVGLDGSDGLQSVTVETAGQRKTIPTSAVFVYVGQSPAAEFLPDSLARDASGISSSMPRAAPRCRRCSP
jgi:thioredoxin reductase (NADPH)